MKTYHLTYPVSWPLDGMPAGQVLAIGHFDGVHLGHKEVLSRAIGRAEKLGVPAAVMTFHPHPRTVLGQAKYEQVLTPMPDKLALFERMGIACTYVVKFDPEFAKVSPEMFVESVLLPMRLNTVVVGFDFTFGHRGLGTADTLCEQGKGRFVVEVVRPRHLDGEKVSSTSIRECLLEGRVEQANVMLGRDYQVRGVVVHGDARGRTLGFPTANLSLSEPYFLPSRGVYAIEAEADGRIYGGVMNIGVKPTFEGEAKMALEAHLFDFEGDLYGRELAVRFRRFLRPERKFASIQELVEQIRRDAASARELLGLHA